jgi:hypothetical protein
MGNFILKVLDKLQKECSECDIITKHKQKNKCHDCYFNVDIHSNSAYTNKKITNNFNIKALRKHHFHFFIYNMNLNFKLPKKPKIDLEGNIVKENDHWVIHHEDENHLNDSNWNLILLLHSEHSRLHRYIYNPMKDKNISDKVSLYQKENNRKKIEDGSHLFIRNNPINDKENHPVYKKMNNVTDWLYSLKENFIIDKKLANFFGYTERYMLTTTIENIISKKNINIEIIKELTKGTSGRISKVYIKQRD